MRLLEPTLPKQDARSFPGGWTSLRQARRWSASTCGSGSLALRILSFVYSKVDVHCARDRINGSTTLTINASVGRIEAGTLLVEKVHQPWAARRAEDEARVFFLF